MPVILEGYALALLLNPKMAAGDLRVLLAPAPDDLLELRKVFPLVKSVKNDGSEALAD